MARYSWQKKIRGKKFRGKKIFVAKKFREIFFENNAIHLRGKKFVAKKCHGKNFRGKKIFMAKKLLWQKNFAKIF